jgi:hypothetical protein
MKTIFSFLTLLLCSSNIFADCAMSGIFVFPKGNTVRQNPIFVLDGYGFSEHTIEGLNKDYPVYLQSGDIKIPLIVKELHKGQFELTQAILVPTDTLAVGLEYTLHIDNMPPYDNLNRHSNGGTWKVLPGKDTLAPVMNIKPKQIDKIHELYGCSPVTYIVFNCPARDNSEMLVKTTVKNLKTGVETVYYIETDGLEIKVGHDMCLGAFKFNGGERYEVEFDFMDASGNTLPWEGPRLKFSKPTKETTED